MSSDFTEETCLSNFNDFIRIFHYIIYDGKLLYLFAVTNCVRKLGQTCPNLDKATQDKEQLSPVPDKTSTIQVHRVTIGN